MADPGCVSASDPFEKEAAWVCDDGYSNDSDALTDYPADTGCFEILSDIEDPACQDGEDNDGDGLIDFDGGVSAWADPTGDPDPACIYPWYASEVSLVSDVAMCKSKRGKQLTLVAPLSKARKLLAKGLTVGECPAAANGVVMCGSKRGKMTSVMVPHGKVQRSLDKGMTLGVCRAP